LPKPTSPAAVWRNAGFAFVQHGMKVRRFVSELFPELRGLITPPPAPVEEVPPLGGDQIEMFEQWEKLGLPALFDLAEKGN